jgi:hypothetical protein
MRSVSTVIFGCFAFPGVVLPVMCITTMLSLAIIYRATKTATRKSLHSMPFQKNMPEILSKFDNYLIIDSGHFDWNG